MTSESDEADFHAECTWGASFVAVEQVNGEYLQSAPETSGCVPSP
jgi:hypothetical protein